MVDAQAEQALLSATAVVAVVGLSTDPAKDSRIVAGHLERNGYRVVPIHPTADAILGETAYPSIAEIPDDLAELVDVVDIFRPAEEVPAIVAEALEHLPELKGIWTQKGIVHDEGVEPARKAGLTVVQDRCIRTQDLFGRFTSQEDDA